jgi:hypothetical protein
VFISELGYKSATEKLQSSVPYIQFNVNDHLFILPPQVTETAAASQYAYIAVGMYRLSYLKVIGLMYNSISSFVEI